MWRYKKILKPKWIHRVTNEEVLKGVNEQRNILQHLHEGNLTGVDCCGISLKIEWKMSED